MSTLDAVLSRIDQDLDQSLERLFALLRIASVSTDPAYKDHCRAAAEHVADRPALHRLRGDFAPDRGPSGGGRQGERRRPGRACCSTAITTCSRSIRSSLWKTPPFEPRIETLPGGRKIIVARGACDDKGQAMTFIEACRAYKAVTGKLPLPITTMIEGEEECGSQHLFEFVRDNAEEFKLDLALVCDTAMWDAETPAVTTSLRGLVYEEVKVTCADRDLHSGLFGGAAQNPLRLLAKILGAMWDDNGRVTIPGFYDGVKDLPADIKADLAALNLTPEEFLGQVGLEAAGRREGPAADRADHHAADRRDQRHRRRLYRRGRQDRHSRARRPPRSRSAWSANRTRKKSATPSAPSCARACRPTARSNSPISAWRRRCSCPSTTRRSTRRAACWPQEWGRKAVAVGAGGSIPIVADFKSVLGMDSLLVGFALDDDRVHSPNEKFDLKCFHKGIRSWARILDALAA